MLLEASCKDPVVFISPIKLTVINFGDNEVEGDEVEAETETEVEAEAETEVEDEVEQPTAKLF